MPSNEVERYLIQKEELNGIMNAGHISHTAIVTRLNETDRDSFPHRFNFFCVNCMAGIEKPLDTMMDRLIIFKMGKCIDEERIKKLPFVSLETTLRLGARYLILPKISD